MTINSFRSEGVTRPSTSWIDQWAKTLHQGQEEAQKKDKLQANQEADIKGAKQSHGAIGIVRIRNFAPDTPVHLEAQEVPIARVDFKKAPGLKGSSFSTVIR